MGEPLKRNVNRLMEKSLYAQAVDKIQSAIRPLLRERGFRVRGRTLNRQTDDGLIQVVNIQMGPSDVDFERNVIHIKRSIVKQRIGPLKPKPHKSRFHSIRN